MKQSTPNSKQGYHLIFKNLKSDSFLQLLFFRNLSFTVLVIVLVFAFALSASIRIVDKNITNTIGSLADFLSRDTAIADALETGQISPEKKASLDELINNSHYIDIISIADNNSIRIYHPVEERIGGLFVGGDEKYFSEDCDNYITTQYGTLGKQRRAFHQVYNQEGKAIGFVMVSSLVSNIYSSYKKVVLSFIPLCILILLLALIISLSMSYRLRVSLLGYSPAEFAEIFNRRNDLLDALEEGILSIDRNGIIIFSNKIAAQLYHRTPQDLEGCPISEVLPECKLKRVLYTKNPEYNCEMKIYGETVLCDRIPLYKKDQINGALCIYRNKTEVTRMAEELTGVKHIIASMRSNMHEFKNHLHVISGLIQLQEYDSVHQYIDTLNTDSMMVSNVTNCIENKTLAALIYGKINLAREQDITMHLEEGCYLPAHNNFLSTNQLVTILGNLLQNSIDATADAAGEKEIELYINCDDTRLKISVDDTGCGISEENLEKIYRRGFSTKGNDRGIGMNLIYSIVKSREGQIVVDTVENEGTTISLSFEKRRTVE